MVWSAAKFKRLVHTHYSLFSWQPTCDHRTGRKNPHRLQQTSRLWTFPVSIAHFPRKEYPQPCAASPCAQQKTTCKRWSFKLDSGNVLLSRGLCPSTISAEKLNVRVRNGYGWILFAVVTRNVYRYRICPCSLITAYAHVKPVLPGEALDRLVLVSSMHCCTSTPNLSTRSSLWGLTDLKSWEISSRRRLRA